jgi:hypothetical protein
MRNSYQSQRVNDWHFIHVTQEDRLINILMVPESIHYSSHIESETKYLERKNGHHRGRHYEKRSTRLDRHSYMKLSSTRIK